MPESPEYEIPACTMPQACYEHGDQKISHHGGASTAIATQWNVEVIPEPRGKTDVPASPEITR